MATPRVARAGIKPFVGAGLARPLYVPPGAGWHRPHAATFHGYILPMPLSRARSLFRLGLMLLSVAVAYIILQPVVAVRAGDLWSFIAYVAAGIGLFVAYIGWRAMRLASEANIIARWLVSPEEWQRYVAACRMRVTMPGALPGAVPLDIVVPDNGIEVQALKRGFRVGDSFHEIGGIGAEVIDMRVIDSPVDLFEFNVRYQVARYSSVAQGVRIPIAADAKTMANTVEDYWAANQPLQLMSVEQLRARVRSGWKMALAGLAAFIGFMMMFAFLNPPAWMAIAPVASMGVAIYGFAKGVQANNVLMAKGG